MRIDLAIVEVLAKRNRYPGTAALRSEGRSVKAFCIALMKRVSIDLQALAASWHMYRPARGRALATHACRWLPSRRPR